jgi:molybdopterin molybdotransferase
MAAMISVEDARAHVLAGLAPTGAEIVALADAWGRVTAYDIKARLTHPPQDVSAMDGYAVRASDPDPRQVVGAAPAGHPWLGVVAQGQAVRLFTGSIVPEGADCVVLQEDTDVDGSGITVRDSIRPGQHIRRAGQDFHEGDVMVAAGTRLTPRQIGVAAAANHAWISVRRRPVVALLATGDEIVLPGETLPPGGIVSSNSHALSALVRACGGTPLLLPIAADTLQSIAEAAEFARAADLLVTTGGASVGDHDLVAQALGGLGLELNFWKVAMRPGKPLMHGHIGRLPLLGLPGNPVSAYLCAVLFLKPMIERLSGLPGLAPTPTVARLSSSLPANDHRADHLRCRLSQNQDGTLIAIPALRQDSGMMRTLSESDGIILRPPHAPMATEGETVQVLRLDQLGV